jgi:hypothetical protein
MKTSLDFAKDIVADKNQQDILPCDAFTTFLIQRYISTVSMSHCNLINSTLNSKLKEWTDTQEIYNFLKCLIPKKTMTYIPYIWKKKEKEDSLGIDIESISDNLEISQKELTNLIDIFPELIENYKDDSEKILKAQK